MEVGCSRIWGLKPTTQTQVSGTPHKPAVSATQPQAPPATPDPKSSTRHTEQWVQWKKQLGRGGRGNPRKHTKATTPNAEPNKSHEDMRRRTPNMRRSRWLLELPEDALGKQSVQTLQAPPTILINPNANVMQRNTTTRHATLDKLCNLLLVVN